MNTVIADVASILKNLPDDCSYEDVQYQLYVIEKIKHSQKKVKEKGSISHDEVENRLKRWL
jgi:hypothetical protein